MRRSNMQQAFIGEPDNVTDLSPDRKGKDQVILDVTGGTVSLVVDSGVPDEAAFENFAHIQGEIALEGGKVLRFQLHEDGGSSAEFVDAGEQTVVEPDLNSTQATLRV